MRGEANSFDKDYTSYVRLLREHASEMPGYLYHAAYLGKWGRLDDPVAGTSVICDRKSGDGVFLDNRHRLWARFSSRTLRWLMGSHASCISFGSMMLGLSDYDWKILDRESTNMPSIHVSGWLAQGVKTIIRARAVYKSMSSLAEKKAATVLAVRTRYRTAFVAEPCPPVVPVPYPDYQGYKSFCSGSNRQRQLVVYDRLQYKNVPDSMILERHTWVTERGNVRALNARDTSLFSVPKGYMDMCKSRFHKNDWNLCEEAPT